ncbi:MAG: hypothetical protein ACM3IH_02885 [Sphingobacteriales bacterium]|jgi:hypothetical protein
MRTSLRKIAIAAAAAVMVAGATAALPGAAEARGGHHHGGGGGHHHGGGGWGFAPGFAVGFGAPYYGLTPSRHNHQTTPRTEKFVVRVVLASFAAKGVKV